MRQMHIGKTTFTVADLLDWQRKGQLRLKAPYQRRSVWKPGAKSYLIDTITRGLPVPIIYLRQRIDLSSQNQIREVVDGQQRLRTIFAFIDPDSLSDYKAAHDSFTVTKTHNPDIAGQRFNDLADSYKKSILQYEFSAHVLPMEAEDRDVLEMFSRLNATGSKLNHQELRNAAYFGEFKSCAYELALEQLERWTDWGLFTDDQITRMREVEFVSDLLLNIIKGMTGRTQKKLDKIYEEFDTEFPMRGEIEKRFRHVMDTVDESIGDTIPKSVYSSEVHFFTLFMVTYNLLFGSQSLNEAGKPKRLPKAFRENLRAASRNFKNESVPGEVLDAVRRASADYGRRKVRFDYLMSLCREPSR